MVGGDSGRATPFLRRNRPSAIPNHQPRRNATYHSREAVQTTEASSPEGRFPKLHAKVALLRFVTPSALGAESQIVRLIVGSANLTSPGYRSNLEVAVAVDDAHGCAAEAATVVR